MKSNSLLLKGIVGASLFFASSSALAAPAPADLSIADRPGTSTSMTIRVFNENAIVGASAYGVSVTVKPIAGAVTQLLAPSNCVRGGNGSFVCALNRVDGQYAKFLNFGITLSPTACSLMRNGQIKVATASVTSAQNPDPNTGNNATNVYVQTSCVNSSN